MPASGGVANLTRYAGCIDSGSEHSGENSEIVRDLVASYFGHGEE